MENNSTMKWEDILERNTLFNTDLLTLSMILIKSMYRLHIFQEHLKAQLRNF